MTSSKTIIITGAGGNLGLTTTETLVKSGHTVIAMVSKQKKGRFAGHQAVNEYAVNLTDEEDVRRTFSAIIQKHPVIDAAILLAGGYAGGTIENTSLDALDKMFSINLKTAYTIAQESFRTMKKQPRGGQLIFIGAKTALHPEQAKNSLAYALSKSLVSQLAEALHAAGKEYRISTAVIAPGTIDTPDNRKAMPDADTSKWVSPDAINQLIERILQEELREQRIVAL